MLRVIRLLLRYLVILVIGVGVGLAAYYGVPRVYRDAIEPIQLNAQRIADLESEVERLNVRLQEGAAARSQSEAAFESRMSDQEGSIVALQEQVAVLTADLEGQSDRVGDALELQQTLSELQASLNEALTRVEALEEEADQASAIESDVDRRLLFMQSMILLTRARLWLSQDNLGLAQVDVQAARSAVAQASQANNGEDLTTAAILERLDRTLTDLKDNPVIAADEMEIAWRLLVEASGLAE